MRRVFAPAAALAAALALGAAARAARPERPPPAHTGGFGEPTCRACHSDGDALGAPDGAMVIGGLPARFEPGRSYEVTVELRRPALARAGFELAVRFAPGEPAEAFQAGSLSPADSALTAVSRDSARAVFYAHHLLPGTVIAPSGIARWVVRWTAPLERQAVVFHAAAVAANDDNSNLGDEVYARAVVVPAAIH